MKSKKYRKKPIIIEASRWLVTGDHSKVIRFTDLHNTRISSDADDFEICKECGSIMRNHGWIKTLKGGHIVCPGDWIIKGIAGEFYPCKPDIFKKTYKEVK